MVELLVVVMMVLFCRSSFLVCACHVSQGGVFWEIAVKRIMRCGAGTEELLSLALLYDAHAPPPFARTAFVRGFRFNFPMTACVQVICQEGKYVFSPEGPRRAWQEPRRV